MAAPADQVNLVYTRLAQLAFLYLDAVRSSDFVRSSIALSMFQQAFVARRDTIDIGWQADGRTLTTSRDATLDRLRPGAPYDGVTGLAIQTVLAVGLGRTYQDVLNALPATLPALFAWATTLVNRIVGDPSKQWIMEMAIDTYGMPVSSLNTTIASYLQRPLATRAAPGPAPIPAVMHDLPPSRTSPVPTNPIVTPGRSYTADPLTVTGRVSKVSPWVIGGLVTAAVGAVAYLVWGATRKERRR